MPGISTDDVQALADHVTVTSSTMLPGRVNVNTASEELLQIPAYAETAAAIVAAREVDHGPFESIGELLSGPPGYGGIQRGGRSPLHAVGGLPGARDGASSREPQGGRHRGARGAHRREHAHREMDAGGACPRVDCLGMAAANRGSGDGWRNSVVRVTRWVGVDIGTACVKVVVLQRRAGKLEVAGAAKAELPACDSAATPPEPAVLAGAPAPRWARRRRAR